MGFFPSAVLIVGLSGGVALGWSFAFDIDFMIFLSRYSAAFWWGYLFPWVLALGITALSGVLAAWSDYLTRS